MKILVTGGTGFIGRHLVRRLLHRPEVAEVRVLDNLFRGARPEACLPPDPRLRFIEGDIRHADTVRQAVDGVGTVFHLAAQSNVLGSVSDMEYSFSSNVTGTFNVLRAAGDARVVFASSREVYGEARALPVAEDSPLAPKNAYGASKMAGEAYCRVFAAQGRPVSVLRLANVYGPEDTGRVIPLFCQRALAGQPLLIYGGGQLIDFVSVDLTCEALLRAAETDLDGPVNIGCGQGTTLPELAARVAACLPGSAVTTELLPPRGPEVERFVAHTGRMGALLGLTSPPDPLAGLSEILAHLQGASA